MPPAIPTASRAPAHTRTRAKKLLTTYGCQQQLRQRPPDSIKPGEVQHCRSLSFPRGSLSMPRKL